MADRVMVMDMDDRITGLHRNTSEIQMSSKAEWHQPAEARVVVTRELEEGQGGGVEPRGRGRTRARCGA